MIDRDILWFVIEDTFIRTNFSGAISPKLGSRLRKGYFHGGTKVILIGKDGGIKSRETTLDLFGIFTRIDAMPMRQREMSGEN